MTGYAPKKIGYKHDGYVARMEAAYIDYSHCNRAQMTTGKKVFTRKWSKRSAPKEYPFATGMYTSILFRVTL